MSAILAAASVLGGSHNAKSEVTESTYTVSPAKNLGPQIGVMRRDPSDIIRVGDWYYVWYTTGAQNSGYDATIWYATSNDGHTWTERGEALARGAKGSWDEQSVFTPNILMARNKFWLFYTAVPKPFFNEGPMITKTAIGIAVSDSPDGPWRKLDTNPVLEAAADPSRFDSMRVDDASLVVREGKYWLYYKGRQWNNTPSNTKMGVAIADNPAGPYTKHNRNPIIRGGHEVVVWPYGEGVAALIGPTGPPGIRKTLQYAEDGISFRRMSDLKHAAPAAGVYRLDAFRDDKQGQMMTWGLQIGTKKGHLPFLQRFDYTW